MFMGMSGFIMTYTLLQITDNFGYSFDILTLDLLLKLPQPSTGLFLSGLYISSTLAKSKG